MLLRIELALPLSQGDVVVSNGDALVIGQERFAPPPQVRVLREVVGAGVDVVQTKPPRLQVLLNWRDASDGTTTTTSTGTKTFETKGNSDVCG